MAEPRKISRSSNDNFSGIVWNAFVDLCAMEELWNLTPIQCRAALAFWYMSEVNNGGHFQYFLNKRHFDHHEVVKALRVLGATACARILDEAIEHYALTPPASTDTVEEYLAAEEKAGLDDFDRRFWEEGNAEIMRCLEEYLSQHESEFVQWIP